jgi:hypothetical protein
MNSRRISLGFTPQTFEPGVHICQIFSEEDEWRESLLKYLVSGTQAGEKTCCFSAKATESLFRDAFDREGIDYSAARKSEAISLSPTEEVYFQDGRFDPDRMLNLLKAFHQASVDEGFAGARVIGEMSPRIQQIDGGDRLMEYESKVSRLLRTCPVTAVCQYDARGFEGATILEILKVHPLMIVRGSVVQNPFFISPEVYLAR